VLLRTLKNLTYELFEEVEKMFSARPSGARRISLLDCPEDKKAMVPYKNINRRDIF